ITYFQHFYPEKFWCLGCNKYFCPKCIHDYKAQNKYCESCYNSIDAVTKQELETPISLSDVFKEFFKEFGIKGVCILIFTLILAVILLRYLVLPFFGVIFN
ncbi:MAG: hypothetical protein ACTSVZ_03915, partial [Promethearchaeota archaeon]